MVESPETRKNSHCEIASVQSTILISQPNYMTKTGDPQVSVKTKTRQPKRRLKNDQTTSSIFQSVPLLQNELVGTLKQHQISSPSKAITDTTKMINYSSDANIQPMTYA